MSNKLFRAIPSHAGAEHSLLCRASPPERAQCMERAVRSPQAHRESSRRRCRWRRAMPTVRCQTSSFCSTRSLCREPGRSPRDAEDAHTSRNGLSSCLRMLFAADEDFGPSQAAPPIANQLLVYCPRSRSQRSGPTHALAHGTLTCSVGGTTPAPATTSKGTLWHPHWVGSGECEL